MEDDGYSECCGDLWPSGVDIRPTDEELIVYYLRKRVFNQPVFSNTIIDFDVYKSGAIDCMYELWTTTNWYFFTPTGDHGDEEHTNRSAGAPYRVVDGDGYWSPVEAGCITPILSSNTHGKRIGFKRRLQYYRGLYPDGQLTYWKMHEYGLDYNSLSTNDPILKGKMTKFVICEMLEDLGMLDPAPPALDLNVAPNDDVVLPSIMKMRNSVEYPLSDDEMNDSTPWTSQPEDDNARECLKHSESGYIEFF